MLMKHVLLRSGGGAKSMKYISKVAKVIILWLFLVTLSEYGHLFFSYKFTLYVFTKFSDVTSTIFTEFPFPVIAWIFLNSSRQDGVRMLVINT